MVKKQMTADASGSQVQEERDVYMAHPPFYFTVDIDMKLSWLEH
jgi:hypothetical protein